MDYRRQGLEGYRLAAIIACALAFAACGGGEDGETNTAGETDAPVASTPSSPTDPSSPTEPSTPEDPSAPESPPEDPQSPPQIGGAPPSSAMVGYLYSFTPEASDAEDALSFSVANKPAWLAFDTATGELSGTPELADLGLYSGITITATAGGESSSLPAFDIDVVAVGTETVTLTWVPPTENTDGSPLLDLAGYRIRYGQESGSYATSIQIDNPGLASHVIDGLVPGDYYFVITAFTSGNLESNYSNEAFKAL